MGGDVCGGGAKTAAEGMPDYGATPAAMIFAYVNGLTLDGFTTAWPSGGEVPERAAVFGDHLRDVLITGFHGAGSASGTRAIRIENSKDVRE